MKPKTIILLILLVLFTIVLFQNSDPTRLQLFLWTIAELPLFILIIACIFLGWVFGWFTHMAYRRRKDHSGTVHTTPEAGGMRETQSRDATHGGESESKSSEKN